MRADTENLISVTELARNTSKIVSDMADDGEPRVILKNNKVAAVLVSAEQAGRINEADELAENVQLWALTLTRTVTDGGARHDLDDVLDELGIDLTDDED